MRFDFEDDRLGYKELCSSDVTMQYVSWLNDPIATRFLEARFEKHTFETVRNFVVSCEKSDAENLYGIFVKTSLEHIGNVKLKKNLRHMTAEIGLIIGQKEFRSQGLGSLIIRAASLHGFSTLGVKKIEAGCYEENIPSLKAFLKAGFALEGFKRFAVESGSQRTGVFLLGARYRDIRNG
jgi:ribosomal-protein-alanine N-acetyltransferase